MASPFRLFRKNMKPLMAVMFVLLMLSWVVGDAVFNYFGGSRNAGPRNRQNAGAVAVSWNGGKLTNMQVQDLVMRRHILNGFLEQVMMMGQRSAYEAGVEPRPLHVQDLRGPDTPQQGIEQSVVDTRIFADAARAAGMNVSDDAVVQYLDELGRGNVSRAQMRDMIARGGSGRISIDDIMAALREELLARNFISSNQYAFETVTPEQRWLDWLRVNDRVVVEAAAIPTEKYLVDVKEPTEAELTAFFDEYKNREASPELAYGTTELPSAVPGFKIPRKVDIQFINANYDTFLAKAEEKITDEEIAKYYEDNKDLFTKADTGLLEDTGEKKGATKPEGSAAPDTKGASDTKADGAAAPADEKAAPAADKPADEKKPAEGAQSPAKDEKKDDQSKSKQQSSLRNGSSDRVFHLVAFQDAAKGDAAKNDGAGKDSAADKSKASDS
ncbi:MAG TPA: hypothetical protein VHU84_06095, partial [Lacipirellulaceae bacterium]|nr:hypothetical protein [Lacipirellulaceae bacterium]